MNSRFETIGFMMDYYIGNTYMGSIPCNNEPGRAFSYVGRQSITLEEDIVFKNKKRIKKGQQVTTMLIPLCGKMIK